MKNPTVLKLPTLEKHAATSAQRQTIRDFLAFVGEKGWNFAVWHGDGPLMKPVPHYNLDSLICEFLGIDEDLLEAERRKLLGAL